MQRVAEKSLGRAFLGSGVRVGEHLCCWGVYLFYDVPVKVTVKIQLRYSY